MKVSIKVIPLKSFNKQVSFAVAGTLNDAVFAARSQLVSATNETFLIRNKWTERGYHVTKASKSNQEAIIGSKQQYIEDQTIGATRNNAAIPTRDLRKNPSSVIYKKRWPSSLTGGRFVYIARGMDKSKRSSRMAGYAVVYKRLKRRLKPLWLIPQTQKVERRFDFRGNVERVVEKEFNRLFPDRLRRALETAK